jgi:protein-disulfide isomerase
VDRRLIWGAVATAVVAVGVLIGFSVAGGEEPTRVEDLQGVAEIRSMLEGIPQDAATLGSPDAPVEIVEFGDLQCPACAQASERVIPELVRRFVQPGDVKITYRPLAFIGPDSERGAFGALAAAEQDALWHFVEVLYHNQGAENSGWLSEDTMESTVESLELDAGKWRSDFDANDVVVPPFEEAEAAAAEENVEITPTFVVRGPRGREVIDGVGDISDFESAIAAVAPA